MIYDTRIRSESISKAMIFATMAMTYAVLKPVWVVNRDGLALTVNYAGIAGFFLLFVLVAFFDIGLPIGLDSQLLFVLLPRVILFALLYRYPYGYSTMLVMVSMMSVATPGMNIFEGMNLVPWKIHAIRALAFAIYLAIITAFLWVFYMLLAYLPYHYAYEFYAPLFAPPPPFSLPFLPLRVYIISYFIVFTFIISIAEKVDDMIYWWLRRDPDAQKLYILTEDFGYYSTRRMKEIYRSKQGGSDYTNIATALTGTFNGVMRMYVEVLDEMGIGDMWIINNRDKMVPGMKDAPYVELNPWSFGFRLALTYAELELMQYVNPLSKHSKVIEGNYVHSRKAEIERARDKMGIKEEDRIRHVKYGWSYRALGYGEKNEESLYRFMRRAAGGLAKEVKPEFDAFPQSEAARLMVETNFNLRKTTGNQGNWKAYGQYFYIPQLEFLYIFWDYNPLHYVHRKVIDYSYYSLEFPEEEWFYAEREKVEKRLRASLLNSALSKRRWRDRAEGKVANEKEWTYSDLRRIGFKRADWDPYYYQEMLKRRKDRRVLKKKWMKWNTPEDWEEFLFYLPDDPRQRALEILNLPEDYTEEQLKQNYRKIVKKYHPDLAADLETKKHYESIMREVTGAKEYLE